MNNFLGLSNELENELLFHTLSSTLQQVEIDKVRLTMKFAPEVKVVFDPIKMWSDDYTPENLQEINAWAKSLTWDTEILMASKGKIISMDFQEEKLFTELPVESDNERYGITLRQLTEAVKRVSWFVKDPIEKIELNADNQEPTIYISYDDLPDVYKSFQSSLVY